MTAGHHLRRRSSELRPPGGRYSVDMAAPDPAELARKIRQHDNELEATYELLQVVDNKIDTLETTVDTGFERLESGQRQILELLRGRDGGTTGG